MVRSSRPWGSESIPALRDRSVTCRRSLRLADYIGARRRLEREQPGGQAWIALRGIECDARVLPELVFELHAAQRVAGEAEREPHEVGVAALGRELEPVHAIAHAGIGDREAVRNT